MSSSAPGGGNAAAPGDSVILEEEIDPNYVPTDDEIKEYAKWLGMDLDKDGDLFWIAKEGLKAPLPENWKPCKTVDTEEIYYFNFFSGESTWDHPCDEYYRKLYEEEKKKKLTESKARNDKVKQQAKQDVAQLLGKDAKTKRRKSSSGSAGGAAAASAQKTTVTELGSLIDSPRASGFDRKPLPDIGRSLPAPATAAAPAAVAREPNSSSRGRARSPRSDSESNDSGTEAGAVSGGGRLGKRLSGHLVASVPAGDVSSSSTQRAGGESKSNGSTTAAAADRRTTVMAPGVTPPPLPRRSPSPSRDGSSSTHQQQQ
eukprot:7908-Heterococcus_DN1.PRE.1